MKTAWPAAFDMSLHFITLLREQLDIPLFDDHTIGLYFACRAGTASKRRQPIFALGPERDCHH